MLKRMLMGVVLVIGCSSTKMKTVWMDEAASERPLHRVLVVGASPDESVRRVYEQKMAQRLQESGVEATPSYELLPSLPQREDVAAAADEGNYDGVVVARFAGRRTETRVAGGPHPYGYGYGPYDYWDYGYHSYYLELDDYVSIETRLFRPEGSEAPLVWSGLTETWEPNNAGDLIEGSVGKVVDRLDQDGLI